MGTIYGLINKTRKESIHLDCKYRESINFNNFIIWLSFEWNKEDWHWVNDSNGGGFPDYYYEFCDMTNSYMNEFKNNYWFSKDNSQLKYLNKNIKLTKRIKELNKQLKKAKEIIDDVQNQGFFD